MAGFRSLGDTWAHRSLQHVIIRLQSRRGRSFFAALGQRVAENFDWNRINDALLQAIARRRGYADHFDWHEKSLKEWGIVQTFKENLKERAAR
jgi:hypothetical protein